MNEIRRCFRGESTQDEFFHAFNALHENHKQIVLTADRKPMADMGNPDLQRQMLNCRRLYR